MAIRAGKDHQGKFIPGHKFGKGRPRGSTNRPIDPPNPMAVNRFRHLWLGITGDLGGRMSLSTGEIQLARRAAFISMHCELMEMKPKLEMAELALYGTLTAHLARTFNLLGLKRQPRDITPTLRDYLDAQTASGDEPT
jgi:hypothetical protein